MKIKTLPAFFNQEVTLAEGKKIKFSNVGELEVDDDLGKELIGKYSTFMFDVEQVFEKEKTVIDKHVDGIVERQQNEIYDLKEQVKQIKSQKEGVEADLKAWQEKYETAAKSEEVAKKALQEEKDSIKKVVDNFEYRISLMNSVDATLRKICSDSGFPKEEWQTLKKNDIIEYLINKS